MDKNKSKNTDLESVPGVGKNIAQDLRDMGINRVDELKGQDPEDMYARLTILRGRHIDRCMLYVFRCAVYYASNDKHDPELLKWWNWKDI
ncbi:Pathogenicity locus [Peptoclostridium litorale DSM 5388]|uniref:Pathogenicity locus n=1 Tax=Peptoclostridium litorale DSM 5388 TaxID=1121324 RepID=A0A069RHQ9_PEPLI|nr:helix-hairpin-helix domain-containing protein [Peptoclostridium litorale]KDR96536.1 hypothetical protein CLIT_2c01420 [Peptoclostridium litorale DSM 5388]SIN69430.1 Pathogenicity locus [Peptoclostridium litorale DSM 5388]